MRRPRQPRHSLLFGRAGLYEGVWRVSSNRQRGACPTRRGRRRALPPKLAKMRSPPRGLRNPVASLVVRNCPFLLSPEGPSWDEPGGDSRARRRRRREHLPFNLDASPMRFSSAGLSRLRGLSAGIDPRLAALASPFMNHLDQAKSELPLHGAQGEAGDKAVQEEVVEQGDRDGDDYRGGHQRLPEEDVAADQLRRHPDADRLSA